MQARTRTLLFILVVVLFVVVAPLLVLYAKGYSFKPESREVVRTGMILINTNVPKVTVTLDDEEPRIENDPVILRGLEPGTYNVKLEREDYEPWEAELTVEVEKVTRVDDVLLTLSNPTLQQPIENTIGKFAVSPNSRFIVYSVTSGKDAGIWMHTNGDELNRLLVSPDDTPETAIDPTKIESIEWSQNSRLVLVRASDGRYWHIAPHVSTPIATELTFIKGIPQQQIQLDQDEPTIVYYTDSKQRLFRWRTTRTDSEPEQLATQVQAFSVATPKVFTLSDDAATGGLELQSYDVRETAPAAASVAPLSSALSGEQSNIISGSASLVAVLSDAHLSLLTRTNGTFGFVEIASDVDQAEWSPNGDLLMYQRGLELWAHDLEPLVDQPSDFLFAQLTEQPESVSWHPAGYYATIIHTSGTTKRVSLAHVSRAAPITSIVATLASSDQPQFARGGLDLVYKILKPTEGLALLTIAEELD